MKSQKVILLVGHRGTGKTTLGRALRDVGFAFHDLDETVEEVTGKTAEEWVFGDLDGFRTAETEALNDLIENADVPTVIAVGAGCLNLPVDPWCIWVRRLHWEVVAEHERPRVKPELAFQDEILWMEVTREPVWATRADLVFDNYAGRHLSRTISELATRCDWLLQLNANRSFWVVPEESSELDIAVAKSKRLGAEGVEIRSDIFTKLTPTDVPYLASLRTKGTAWLHNAHSAAAIDIDVDFVDEIVRTDALSELTPRRLILSTHPMTVDVSDVERLVNAVRKLERAIPKWVPFIELKYAPGVDHPDDLGLAKAIVAPLVKAGLTVSVLVQGENFGFVRPLWDEPLNYLPSRSRAFRFRPQLPATSLNFDFENWLPHFVGAPTTEVGALLGGDCQRSQGPIWHRRCAISDGRDFAYMAVTVDPKHVHAMLDFFVKNNIHCVSVTSPFKSLFSVTSSDQTPTPYDSRVVDFPDSEIAFANTLHRQNNAWVGCDTDVAGMEAVLSSLESRDVGPGTIAVIGTGAASRACLRAIDDSDWACVTHVGGRAGWDDGGPKKVTLLVNATGLPIGGQPHEPNYTAWLDLHYIYGEPSDDCIYENGDRFFDAQAEGQIRFWFGEENER